jgi:uncharacterized protein YhaN
LLRIERLVATLGQAAGDRSWQTLIEEVQAYSRSDHQETVARLQKSLEEIEHQQHQLVKEYQGVLHAIDSLHGATTATDAQQDLLLERERLSELVATYCHTVVQCQLLDEIVERYCDEAEQPILRAASRYFSLLTNGAYTGLKVVVTTSGEECIAGVRKGDTIPVEPPHLSEGTADQLFLALRLAGLEEQFRVSRPVPLFFDDAFLTFDGDRLRSAFRTLDELAQKTQVIYLTHDLQVAGLARELGFRITELPYRNELSEMGEG